LSVGSSSFSGAPIGVGAATPVDLVPQAAASGADGSPSSFGAAALLASHHGLLLATPTALLQVLVLLPLLALCRRLLLAALMPRCT
jgi:hypothetical protein